MGGGGAQVQPLTPTPTKHFGPLKGVGGGGWDTNRYLVPPPGGYPQPPSVTPQLPAATHQPPSVIPNRFRLAIVDSAAGNRNIGAYPRNKPRNLCSAPRATLTVCALPRGMALKSALYYGNQS